MRPLFLPLIEDSLPKSLYERFPFVPSCCSPSPMCFDLSLLPFFDAPGTFPLPFLFVTLTSPFFRMFRFSFPPAESRFFSPPSSLRFRSPAFFYREDLFFFSSERVILCLFPHVFSTPPDACLSLLPVFFSSKMTTDT